MFSSIFQIPLFDFVVLVSLLGKGSLLNFSLLKFVAVCMLLHVFERVTSNCGAAKEHMEYRKLPGFLVFHHGLDSGVELLV